MSTLPEMEPAHSPLFDRCPTCGVRLTLSPSCRRCSTDLLPVARLVRESWRLRSQALEAIGRDDPLHALRLASAAAFLHACPSSLRLRALSEMLVRAAQGAPDSHRTVETLPPITPGLPERVLVAPKRSARRPSAAPWWRRILARILRG